MWDRKTEQQIVKLDGQNDNIRSVCTSPDGNTLAYDSDDNSIRLWDVVTGQKKPIQMVIIIMFTKSNSLLMEMNQFHIVMISLQEYGMQIQDKNFNTIEIVIRKFLDNLLDNNLQKIPLQLLLQLF
ncbi:unnamed protein product [Paramecium primaurelia]|uniref:Uncharacterized protein n=1 Tax=Paramecium primaurelia TaxID=5886 RepID=A0A8S1QMG2_PARPR|nr:unnamed protein product [Paramecium primaurelia]